MVTTRTKDLTLPELRQMLEETERVAGPDAQSTRVLRRLVAERELRQREADAE